MDDSENSFESIPANNSPPRFVTPRVPFSRDSPLSTKREKQKRTPQFRRPAPKVAKTAPPMRSVYSNIQYRTARLITNSGSTAPLISPIYDKTKNSTYFEQCFKIDAIIGKGSFGEVFAVQSLEDSRRYAVKVSIQLIRQNCASKYREVENHMRLPQHTNLVEFVKAWEEGGRLYIQQELCEKSLLQHCMEKHALPEPELWNIFVDLLKAVDLLHSNEMIHDDIKPDNIFLTSQSICKLGDFGLVINLKNPKDVDSAEEGDSKYLAPEVLNASPSKASDIFSLGVTLLEAATDLDIPSNGESWHHIRNGLIPERFFIGISNELRDLIQWMLSSDPNSRPTARELLHHPCIRRRIPKRRLFISAVGFYNFLTNWSFVILTWFIALFSFVVHPPWAAFSAVCQRRSSICALTIGKQHTPIQTPEASKVFARSLSPTTPFDFSDDEGSVMQRKFWPQVPVLRMDDDDDDDDDEVPTSSSNSSTIESFVCPSPAKPQNVAASAVLGVESPRRGRSAANWRHNTPQSARRILPPSARNSPARPLQNRLHPGSGDFEARMRKMEFDSDDDCQNGVTVLGDEVNESEAKMRDWQKHQKYERMMRMQNAIDSDDNDAVLTTTEVISTRIHNGVIPQSCPPMLRSGRKLLKRAPRLDFTLLDGNNDNTGVSDVVRPIRGGKGRAIGDQDSSADDA